MLGYGAIGQFTIGQVSDFLGPIVQPWTDPPKPKIKAGLAIALIASGLYAPIPIKDESKLESRWHQPLSEPVRKLERIGLRDRYPFVASAVHIGWFNPLSEPVPRAKSGLNSANQQAFAFNPFPIVPIPINIGWFNNLSDPVRRIRTTLTPAPIVPTVLGEIITTDKWFASFAEPIRAKSGLRVAYQRDYFAEPFSLTQKESVSEDRWHQPWSEPARKKEDKVGLRVRYPFIYGSVYMSWFGSLSEPVRVKQGLSVTKQQTLAFYPFPLPPPVTIDNISWFNNLSDPTRRIRSTPTDQEFLPLFPPTPSFGWFDGLTDPTRKVRVTASFDSQAPIPLPTVSFGWFEGLADPVRKPRVTLFDPQNFVFQVTPAVTFGWFGSLNDPSRRKPSPISLDQDFSPFPIVSFSWFGGLSEPVRKIPRVAWTDHISFQFPIVPFSWFNRLDDPTLPKKRVIGPPYFSFSPNPIQLSFGWYGNLTEPVRVKPEALQQIFSVSPEFTQPFFYLAALNTTEQRDFLFAVLYQFNPPLRAYVDIIEIKPET